MSMLSSLHGLKRVSLALGLLLLPLISINSQTLSPGPAARLLPDILPGFKALGPAKPVNRELAGDAIARAGITSAASRGYFSKDGQRFFVTLITTASDSGAYSLLTTANRMSESSGSETTGGISLGNVGTASFSYWDGLANDLFFFKGRAYLALRDGGKQRDTRLLVNFGKGLAETLDKGEGDIPVLVKHLPDWEKASKEAVYAVSVDTLKEQFSNPVLDEVSFAGGAESVSASYGKSELVLIEFNTPQLAGDNDVRIAAKIRELRSQGQSVPTAYRRVGNYSVFVFNAPDEQAAKQLIDQVKYQQVVQWLGNRPDNLAERQREFIETTLGVFVSVVKASGIAIVLCVAVGGFLGALLFSRRRARQATAQAYSDAGGMLRLNIDELSAPTDARKLIGPGNG